MAWLGTRAGLRRAVGVLGIIAIFIFSSACDSGSSTSQIGAKSITDAVLGGPAQTFITKYGPLVVSQSNTTTGELHFQQYPGVATDALVVYTGKYLTVTPGDNDVGLILVSQTPGQVWNPADAKAACTIFIPADAKSVRSVSTADNLNHGMVSGREDIYTSAMLAKTFPAYAFSNADQGMAPAGTFNVWYSDTVDGDSSTFKACVISLGES